MAQNAGAEILEPGDVFGHHVELDDVGARFFRRAKDELELGGLAGREIARKSGAAAVPIQFLFIGAQQMRA